MTTIDSLPTESRAEEPRLSEAHRAQLRASGLSDATIDAMCVYTETDPARVAQLLRWQGDEGPAPALVFPYFGPDGQAVKMEDGLPMVTVRPDRPRKRNGRVPKYEHPVGVKPRPYFAPIGARPDNLYAPILHVEGIKKAAAAAQAHPTVCVVSWQGVYPHDAEKRRETEDWVLAPELASLPLETRKVYIGYDGADVLSNPHVALAEARTAQLYSRAGAHTYLLRIPYGQPDNPKGGLDDWLATENHPEAALRGLIGKALHGDPLVRIDQDSNPGAFLKEMPFVASIRVASSVDQDRIKQVLSRKAGIRKTSINDMLSDFARKLAPANKDESHRKDTWKNNLIRTNEGTVRASAANALTIAECPELTLSLNLMGHVPTLEKPPPWPEPKKDATYPRPLMDKVDGIRAARWAEQVTGAPITAKLMNDAIYAAASRRPYHPVQEYLSSLEWDGKERLDFWMTELLGARETDFVRAAGRMWMISAVARAFEPGCKVDHVLVLEGDQGLGKSTAYTILGGEWYSEINASLDQKDAMMQTHAAWIIEMAELASMRKVDVDKTKAFITRKEDKFRPPYGSQVETFKRSSVFGATVNPGEYLRDTTGGRRFWPVWCDGPIKTDELTHDRDQLWAEAFVLYQNGVRWWMDKDQDAEILKQAVFSQQERTADDPWLEPISQFLEHGPHRLHEGKSYVTTNDGLDHLSQLQDLQDSSAAKWKTTDSMRMAGIYRQLGWGLRKQVRQGKMRKWGFFEVVTT